MRAVLVGCLVTVACGGPPARDTRLVAKDALAKATTDLEAMTRLVRGNVVSGGVWFDDATCRTKFPGGEVAAANHAEFARCLVSLKLQPSAREDALGDVVVMTYAPGFEVEVRVVQELDGPRLAWIGFESRREQDVAPTISGDALEALRVAGDRDGPLDEATRTAIEGELQDAPKNAVYTWLKVCIDHEGAVRSADGFETTSVKAQPAFRTAAMAWKFRPFVVGDKAIPVCAMARLVYPPGATLDAERIPLPPPPTKNKPPPLVLAPGRDYKLLEAKRIEGTTAIVPDDDTKRAMGRGRSRVEGGFRVCIDAAGKVESVLPFRSTGFANYDNQLIRGMHAWRYSPFLVDDQPTAVCTKVTFHYTQK